MEPRYLRANLWMLGFRLSIGEKGLLVSPASLLTPDLRDGITQHRDALLADVRANPDLVRRCIDCGTELQPPLKWRCPGCLHRLAPHPAPHPRPTTGKEIV